MKPSSSITSKTLDRQHHILVANLIVFAAQALLWLSIALHLSLHQLTMKATLLLLAPAMALAGSNITTTCQSVSIDSSSGVLSAMCNDTSEAQYFSQLDLNQCLGYNKTLISEAK
jgi:hypothetical protein